MHLIYLLKIFNEFLFHCYRHILWPLPGWLVHWCELGVVIPGFGWAHSTSRVSLRGVGCGATEAGPNPLLCNLPCQLIRCLNNLSSRIAQAAWSAHSCNIHQRPSLLLMLPGGSTCLPAPGLPAPPHMPVRMNPYIYGRNPFEFSQPYGHKSQQRGKSSSKIIF